MKSKRNVFFGVAIFAIYLITVLAYILSLFAEYKSGPSRAEFRFAELVRETNQNLQVNNPGSESFTNTFLRSVGDVSDVAGIQLVEDGKLILSYPKNLSEQNGRSSALVIPKSTTLKTKTGSSLTLTVALYSLKPSSISQKGLMALLVVLVATIACVAYLICSVLMSRDKSKSDDSDDLPEEDEIVDDSKHTFFDDELFEEDSKRIENDLLKDDLNDGTDNDDAEQADFAGSGESFEAPDESDIIVDAQTSEDFPVDDNETFISEETDQVDFVEDEVDFVEPKLEDAETVAGVETDDGVVLENTDLSLASESEVEPPIAAEGDIVGETAPISLASNITQEEYQALTKDLIPAAESTSEPELEENIQAVQLPAVLDDTSKDVVPQKKVLSPEECVLKPLPALEVKSEEKKTETPVRKSPPEGLFSPVTGFGWEEYMLPRLDSELMRSASSDQELALFTLSIPKFDWGSDAGKAVSDLIKSTFKFRDMIFEYKDTGCIIIAQGLDGKQALDKAENLHTDIIAELAKRREYHIVSIGIANRSLRLISGSRLANESEQALFHAMEDTDSPIVAFKINPEKYRNFIAEEEAKKELEKNKGNI